MTTATKIKLQGTNVSVCLLSPIEILEGRYKLSDDHEGIVARDLKPIPGKTRRGTSYGAPVGTYPLTHHKDFGKRASVLRVKYPKIADR